MQQTLRFIALTLEAKLIFISHYLFLYLIKKVLIFWY